MAAAISPTRPGLRSGTKTFLVLLLAGILAFKLVCALAGYPRVWGDEIAYTEPAIQWVSTGVYATPGLARQLELKGVPGLERNSFMSVPLGAYARVPVNRLLGTDQTRRRVADWLFLVLATGVLFCALRPWGSGEIALFCCLVFCLHKFTGNDTGRPDTLSLAFGLAAPAVWSGWWRRHTHETAARPPAGLALLTGFLIGLSGLTHQFGGVFWAVMVVALVIAQAGRTLGLAGWARWLFFFGLGGLAGICLWLPQIWTAPDLWSRQFFYMLHLKQHLDKSFTGSLLEQLQDTLLRNPAVLLVLVAGLAVTRRRWSSANPVIVLLGCLAGLTVWRCTAFEVYQHFYSIHFWAVICLLLGLLTPDVVAFIAARLPDRHRGWIRPAVFAGVLLPGLFSLYEPFVEVFVLPSAQVRSTVIHLLQARISPGDRVLASPDFYFDVPATHKSVWMWAETLDLKQYDALVVTFPSKASIQVFEHRDQWDQWFTPQQARDFAANYELTDRLPPPPTRPGLPADFDADINTLARKLGMNFHRGPHIEGCYIYRNRHPAPAP
jgi:hypothetical protein